MLSQNTLLHFQITKQFPGFKLDCEATFKSGITAIFGASASGKTTLLNCIGGLLIPDEGVIEALGEIVFSSEAGINLPPEKRKTGYVFQDSALFPHMSVRDNIMYGYKLIPKSGSRANLDKLVDLFVLTDLMDRGVSALSGGERQRVALARAIAASPHILLLDEPMASLDMLSRGSIIRYLRSIWNELRIPILYVSHSISEVLALAGDVLVLKDGKIVMQGPPTRALVHPGVTTKADYISLQNFLEAEVMEEADDDGLTLMKIGNALLRVLDVSAPSGEVLTVSIPSSEVILSLDIPLKLSAQNIVPGKVSEIHVMSSRVLVYIDVGVGIVAEITKSAHRGLEIKEGLEVYLVIKSTSVVPLDGSLTSY